MLVLNGDVPLVTAEALADLIEAHAAGGAQATVASMELDDPAGYGRVVRREDGSVARVVETKVEGDATAEELAIREVNAGVYAFDGAALQGRPRAPDARQRPGRALPALDARAARPRRGPSRSTTRRCCSASTTASTSRACARSPRPASTAPHMRAGVTIVDPASTLVDVTVAIGADTVVEPSSFLRGATTVGERCAVGPLTTLIDTALGDEVRVPHSYLVECEVRAGASVGPFAYLRPGTLLRERAKAGTFVEIKNSDIGEGTKVPHLSYIGDADVGPNTNLGAGDHHRQLRRLPQAPHDDRRERPHVGRHDPRRAGDDRRRRVHAAPTRRSPTTCRPAPSGSRASARPTSRATPSAGRSARRRTHRRDPRVD